MRNVLAILLLVLWLIFGAWFYVCKVKNLCGQGNAGTEQVENTLNGDENTQLKEVYQGILDIENSIQIHESDSVLKTDESFDENINLLATYLQNHPSTKISITGPYANSESNDSNSENLGLARIEQIQDALLNAGVDANQIVLNSTINDELFIDSDRSIGNSMIDFIFPTNENDKIDFKSAHYSLGDLESTSLFNKDNDKVSFDYNQNSIDHLISYLNKTDHNLQITASYSNDETASLEGYNNGLLRAYDIKQQLIKAGIDGDRILINSNEDNDIFDVNGQSLAGNIHFDFKDKNMGSDERIAEAELIEALNDDGYEDKKYEETPAYYSNNNDNSFPPLYSTDEAVLRLMPLVNFCCASDELQVNERLISFVRKLKPHLDKYPEKTLYVTGHTDNSNEEDANKELGMDRAENMKKLLVRSFIKPERIKVRSAGSHKPVASNDSSAGRFRNRRVELDIR